MLAVDREVGQPVQVAKQMLSLRHVSPARLGHSLCQLIHDVEDVMQGNLYDVRGDTKD